MRWVEGAMKVELHSLVQVADVQLGFETIMRSVTNVCPLSVNTSCVVSMGYLMSQSNATCTCQPPGTYRLPIACLTLFNAKARGGY